MGISRKNYSQKKEHNLLKPTLVAKHTHTPGSSEEGLWEQGKES